MDNNDVALNDGKEGANDERKDQTPASTSQINPDLPFLPPPDPPSLDPSAFSPSSHQDPSQLLTSTDLKTGDLSISQLSSLVRQLVSTVGQLRTANEAQLDVNARQASSITRLSLENDTFKRINQDQERVIGELSRAAVPEGFWVWESRREEGREGEGRWVWSLEKYKVLPPLAVASGPPISLLSLPVELLTIILDLLDRKERLVLCRVSFKLLELASDHLYGGGIILNADAAYAFVEARVFWQAPKSDRITPLLLSDEVRFISRPTVDAFDDLLDLSSFLSSPLSPLRLATITVEVKTYSIFLRWTGLLRFVDPLYFQLWIGDPSGHVDLPSIQPVPLDFATPCSSHWTRLGEVSFLGPGSVLLVEETEGTSAFDACLRRCNPSLVPRCQLWIRMVDGTVMTERVQAKDITSTLGRRFPDDGLRDLVSFDFVGRPNEEGESEME